MKISQTSWMRAPAPRLAALAALILAVAFAACSGPERQPRVPVDDAAKAANRGLEEHEAESGRGTEPIRVRRR